MKTLSDDRRLQEIQNLLQIHPQLKKYADKLTAYDNGVEINPYSFPQDDEIQYCKNKSGCALA